MIIPTKEARLLSVARAVAFAVKALGVGAVVVGFFGGLS